MSLENFCKLQDLDALLRTYDRVPAIGGRTAGPCYDVRGVKSSAWPLAPLLLLASACATTPSRRPPFSAQARAGQGLPPLLLAASPSPTQEPARIGKAELDQARALLSRARKELRPRQWELLDSKLADAERAWQRFDALSRRSGKAAEVPRGAEGLPAVGLVGVGAGAKAGTLSSVGAASLAPLLAALALLWPSSTAGPEADAPPWLPAQLEFEAKLREVADASQQVRTEIEASKNPPAPPPVAEEDERPQCKPVPVPHRGGDAIHDTCADEFPPNRFPGHDVLVNGKRFDALQRNARVLWEIKTDRFDSYSPFLQRQVIIKQVAELQRERDIALECGYDFVVGVSSAAHLDALQKELREHKIVITGC